MKIYSLKTSLALLVIGVLVMFLSLSALATIITGAHAISALSVAPDLGFTLLQGTDPMLGVAGLAIAASIVLGASGFGAALGMASTSAAALGAITERPELFGKTILYVVFIEAVAIYGFVIAFMLIGYIPQLIP